MWSGDRRRPEGREGAQNALRARLRANGWERNAALACASPSGELRGATPPPTALTSISTGLCSALGSHQLSAAQPDQRLSCGMRTTGAD